MRRHVQGVRGGSCDRMIVQGSVNGPHSQWRNVIRVDDVVDQSRMSWILVKQFLEHCSSVELSGISLVGRISGCGERQRVENFRFYVVRIRRTHGGSCAFIRQYARTLINGRGVSK